MIASEYDASPAEAAGAVRGIVASLRREGLLLPPAAAAPARAPCAAPHGDRLAANDPARKFFEPPALARTARPVPLPPLTERAGRRDR